MGSPDPTPEETRPNLKMNLVFARVFFLGWGSINHINHNVDVKAKDNQNLIKNILLTLNLHEQLWPNVPQSRLGRPNRELVSTIPPNFLAAPQRRRLGRNF